MIEYGRITTVPSIAVTLRREPVLIGGTEKRLSRHDYIRKVCDASSSNRFSAIILLRL